MPHEFTVAGGGIAGLISAIALAEKGARVRLLERSANSGGRAATQQQKGFSLNLGAHALYRHGPLYQALQRWQIPFSGQPPKQREAAYLVKNGRKFIFPGDPQRLLLSRALSLADKLQAATLFRKLPASGLTVKEWLDQGSFRPQVRKWAEMVIRLTTYSNATSRLGAAAAVTQVQFAIQNGVLYLDGGWATLIDGLAAKARAMGVTIETGKAIDQLTPGTVLAIAPEEIERMTHVKLPARTPSRVACFDLGLRRLPKGSALFAMDLEQPLYLAVHSASARLAPEGSALVHIVRYGEADRDQMEAFADLLLPGWRNETEVARFLPSMIVAHDVPGPAGRAPVQLPGYPGVAIAGDWVGPHAMLSDAAAASALEAAELVWKRSAIAA